MKKLSLFILLLTAISLSACVIQEDVPVPVVKRMVFNPNDTTKNVGCNVNGFDAGIYSQVVRFYKTNNDDNYMNLSFLGENSLTISFTLIDTTVGTYSLGSFSGIYFNELECTTGKTNYETNVTGKVLITNVNSIKKTISGSFSFYAKERYSPNSEITVSEGVFKDINYTK